MIHAFRFTIMNYKILVSTYAGTSNKGTEALLRGLSSILQDAIGEKKLVLSMASIQPQTDRITGVPGFSSFYQRYSSNISGHKGKNLRRLTKLAKKFHLKDLAFYFAHYELLNAIRRQDLFIEMGADNYDVEYGAGYQWLYELHAWIKKYTNTKMLLYNCSLNPNSITPEFIQEIKRFSATTIRESESLKNLEKAYQGDDIYLCPDPAFVMAPEETPLPEIMSHKECVGINLSDLILRDAYGADKKLVYNNYFRLIDHIVDNTGMGVILLPHVMKNQDLSALRAIYERYTNTTNVTLLDNERLSAPQLKYIISKLKYLVTARTHASIAAYSSIIPTLVLGYSTKSKGIATDLFGSYDDYVLYLGNLHDSDTLLRKFCWIVDNSEKIKQQLIEIMPSYQNQSRKIGIIVTDLLKTHA